MNLLEIAVKLLFRAHSLVWVQYDYIPQMLLPEE